jgi:pimeloyl-ACP methyl ester carboxylesterase
VRRGWGRSEDPGHGYDIETQATDILGLLDALNIERAVFAGRTMATHEMLWIAENRPERVIALAFLNTPLLPLPDVEPSPEMERFSRMYARTSTDIGRGEEIDRRLERGDWRPRFLSDPDARIAVPALLTQHPVVDADGVSFTAMRLDRLENWSAEQEAMWAGDPEAQEYAEALRKDPARLERLRREAEDAAMNPRLRDALRRAFGDRLTVVWESPREQGHDDFLDECEQLLRPYFARVTGTGAED